MRQDWNYFNCILFPWKSTNYDSPSILYNSRNRPHRTTYTVSAF